MVVELKIFNLDDVTETPMPGGRGTQKHMINEECGANALDVHLNILNPREPGGRYHHHTQADNVYIVKQGEGQLVVEGKEHTIRENDVVYIPAGSKHSLTNANDQPLEIFEIYAPAGNKFDFVLDKEVDQNGA